MNSDFDSRQPIYQQIIDKIITQIAKGDLAPGAKIASVRDLAMEYNVNPNTMQKSLAKLEEMGYLHTERTSGRFVTKDLAAIQALMQHMPQKIIGDFVAEMTGIGIAPRQICGHVAKYIEGMEDDGQNIGN